MDEISHTSGAREKMLFRRIWIGKALLVLHLLGSRKAYKKAAYVSLLSIVQVCSSYHAIDEKRKGGIRYDLFIIIFARQMTDGPKKVRKK